MSPPLILTQLPTKLTNSPLYQGHYGCEDGGIEVLKDSVEAAFSYIDTQGLEARLLRLRLLLGGPMSIQSPLEVEDPFDRLIATASSSDSPEESILWLLKLSTVLSHISKAFVIKHLCFLTDIDNTGAYLVRPISIQTTRSSRRDHFSFPDHRGSEGLRSRLLEKMRRDIPHQYKS